MEMEFGESSAIGGQNESMELTLGFRFDPLPHELIGFYLKLKNLGDFTPTIQIPEVDLYACHPKKLTTENASSLVIDGNGRYYYFTKRKRRDERGSRIIRSVKNEGYWKTTSTDKDINDDNNKKIGHCKTFTFYEEEREKETNWIMQEFRDLNTKIEHYVLCMIYEKKCPTNYPPST